MSPDKIASLIHGEPAASDQDPLVIPDPDALLTAAAQDREDAAGVRPYREPLPHLQPLLRSQQRAPVQAHSTSLKDISLRGVGNAPRGGAFVSLLLGLCCRSLVSVARVCT